MMICILLVRYAAEIEKLHNAYGAPIIICDRICENLPSTHKGHIK